MSPSPPSRLPPKRIAGNARATADSTRTAAVPWDRTLDTVSRQPCGSPRAEPSASPIAPAVTSPSAPPHNLPAFAAAQHAQSRALKARRRKLKRQATESRQGADHADPPLNNDSLAVYRAALTPAQQRGTVGENDALRLIEAAGLRCLARNLRCPLGEIDLAARDGDVLVIVEVRARGDARFGGAAGSVDSAKQRRLARAAHWFLPTLARKGFGGKTPRCRFDVIAFEGATVHWIRDAFVI